MRVQIFASDIDDRALSVARHGVYPEAIVTDVSLVRLQQYFQQESGAYRVKRSLREQITFSRHNVLRDPPFSRVDLITCRNLLIYLEREVQAQVLEISTSLSILALPNFAVANAAPGGRRLPSPASGNLPTGIGRGLPASMNT